MARRNLEKMSPRERKGLEIASRMRIVRKDGYWHVPSQTKTRKLYKVTFGQKSTCTCEDFLTTSKWCKHIYAVKDFIEQHFNPKEIVPLEELPDKPRKPTYPQNWPAYNAAQCNEKRKFRILLSDLCSGLRDQAPSPNGGRPRLDIRDVVYALLYKVYSTFATRRFMTDLEDAQKEGLISALPHYNSMLNYLSDENLTPLLLDLIGVSSQPLTSIEKAGIFAGDSSGFSVSRFDRWLDERGKESHERKCVKASVMVGVRTHVVAGIEILEADDNDSPTLPSLVNQTKKRFKVKEVCADKGFSSVRNLKAIDGIGAKPFIPFKENATGAAGGLWEKMFLYYEYRRDDFLKHYHLRSNAETVFSMVQRKFGAWVRAKGDVAMKNEVLAKFICHNICCVIQSMYELDIEPEFYPDEARANRA